MHQIHRKGLKLGGTFTVYDGREDANSHGVTNIKDWKDYSVEVGDWVEYPDGTVTEVIRVYIPRRKNGAGMYRSKHITTRLNCYSQSQSSLTSQCLPYSCSTVYTKPETITAARNRFAEAWLLEGLSITAACRKHLWQSSKGPGGNRNFKTYAYLVISLPWFDELLKSNRLIRDRYMSLVGALTTEGVTEAYVAQQLKKDIDGDDAKKHINAINHAIDILTAEASRKKTPIMTSWKLESEKNLDESPRQLKEPAKDISTILEETVNAKDTQQRSAVSETKREAPVLSFAPNEVSRTSGNQTHRDTPIPAQAVNG